MPSKYFNNVSNENLELFKKPIYNYPTRSVYSKPNTTISIDLVDFVNNPDGQYKYILTAIDVSSRKATALPMTNKNISEFKRVLPIVFSDLFKPMLIWSDQEPALLSNELKTYLNSLNIEIYHTFGDSKAAIVERFNLTLKNQMVKTDNMQSWVGFLPKFIESYNSAEHSSIKMTPNDAINKPQKVDEINIQKVRTIKDTPNKTQFQVNDRVRILTKKQTFEKKSTTPNYSKEIFQIYQILNTNPPTYRIKDLNNKAILGSVYGAELLKTKF
jgi:hypothetical protein